MNKRPLSDQDIRDLRFFLRKIMKDSGYEENFSDDESLILRHGMDSLSVTKLILFLEERYGISLSERVSDISDLDSFNKILKVISPSS